MKITIGGPAGSGKGTVGRKLAKKLGYKYVCGGDMFRKVAEEHGMTMEEFDIYMKENPEARVDAKIDGFQKRMGKEEDNFVLEARMAWYCVPDSIKIKIDADEDERMRRISGDSGKNRIAYKKRSLEETRKKERKRFAVHSSKMLEIYGVEDFTDDKHYDFVVDSTNISPDEVVEVILKKLEEYGKIKR